jgi:hypothetical protein
LAIWTKPLARQTLRVRYCVHCGLPKRPESTFAVGIKLHNFNPLQAKVDSIPID